MARFVADSEAIYSYEGTREVNLRIVGVSKAERVDLWCVGVGRLEGAALTRRRCELRGDIGKLEARPRGFEPLTFGSVDRRPRAEFGSTEPNMRSQVAT